MSRRVYLLFSSQKTATYGEQKQFVKGETKNLASVILVFQRTRLFRFIAVPKATVRLETALSVTPLQACPCKF